MTGGVGRDFLERIFSKMSTDGPIQSLVNSIGLIKKQFGKFLRPLFNFIKIHCGLDTKTVGEVLDFMKDVLMKDKLVDEGNQVFLDLTDEDILEIQIPDKLRKVCIYFFLNISICV